jgi:hypothetical protein
MPERGYFLRREHDERPYKVILPIPPINTKYMDHKNHDYPNKH